MNKQTKTNQNKPKQNKSNSKLQFFTIDKKIEMLFYHFTNDIFITKHRYKRLPKQPNSIFKNVLRHSLHSPRIPKYQRVAYSQYF